MRKKEVGTTRRDNTKYTLMKRTGAFFSSVVAYTRKFFKFLIKLAKRKKTNKSFVHNLDAPSDYQTIDKKMKIPLMEMKGNQIAIYRKKLLFFLFFVFFSFVAK